MDHPIRRAVALLGVGKRHADDFLSAGGIEHVHGGRRDGVRPQAVGETEINQNVRSVGRELNAGAGFLEPLGLFQYDDAKSIVRQRKSGGQAPNSGPGNDDSARGRQDTPSVGWIRRSHRAGRIPPVSRRRARAPGCADIMSSNRDRHARPRRPCRNIRAGGRTAALRRRT